MTQREMFEQSFKRPRNFFQLSMKDQWRIDKELGILDWSGEGMTKADRERFRHYFGLNWGKPNKRPRSKQ